MVSSLKNKIEKYVNERGVPFKDDANWVAPSEKNLDSISRFQLRLSKTWKESVTLHY